jgi:uncharacterized damage-inducible protein DinB
MHVTWSLTASPARPLDQRWPRGDPRAAILGSVRHDDVGDQLDYLVWMRARILAAAAGLGEDELRSLETVTNRGLRATLVHQLENEWAWRIRLSEGAFPADDQRPADDLSHDELVDAWQREERALRAWFEGLTDHDLETPPRGPDDSLPMWRYLMYVVNHGTQQFTEAAVLLTRLGRSPGEIGYLAFARGERPGLPPAAHDAVRNPDGLAPAHAGRASVTPRRRGSRRT